MYTRLFNSVFDYYQEKKIGLHFGEIDCSSSEQICDEYEIVTYPSLYFFYHSEKFEYEDNIEKQKIITFIDHATRPLWKQLQIWEIDSLEKLIFNEMVHYIYLIADTEDNMENEETLQLLETLAEPYRCHAQFSTLRYPELIHLDHNHPFGASAEKVQNITNGSLLAIRGHNYIRSRPMPSLEELRIEIENQKKFVVNQKNDNLTIIKNYHPHFQKRNKMKNNFIERIDNDGFDYSLVEWIEDNLLVLLPQLDSNTFRRIIMRKVLVVILLIDPNDQFVFNNFQHQLKKLSWNDSRFAFCWIDSYYWEKYIQRFGVQKKNTPWFVVVDYFQNEFYINEIAHNQILTIDKIMKFLDHISSGKAKPQKYPDFSKFKNPNLRRFDSTLFAIKGKPQYLLFIFSFGLFSITFYLFCYDKIFKRKQNEKNDFIKSTPSPHNPLNGNKKFQKIGNN
ncbi:protein disulfide-isomerase tmx3 [Anaeramoeba flamelloides]|uniref:Protein disulfide-isomerase tmx3 n=1 Tax=Anaeramoeba flamelloides TaxID=1746091 RepID=A0ABQ8X1P2_9EUKA|nr:protein disulfide-isomerase tmx3 [Anaeramoeba flamelloides]